MHPQSRKPGRLKLTRIPQQRQDWWPRIIEPQPGFLLDEAHCPKASRITAHTNIPEHLTKLTGCRTFSKLVNSVLNPEPHLPDTQMLAFVAEGLLLRCCPGSHIRIPRQTTILNGGKEDGRKSVVDVEHPVFVKCRKGIVLLYSVKSSSPIYAWFFFSGRQVRAGGTNKFFCVQ